MGKSIGQINNTGRARWYAAGKGRISSSHSTRTTNFLFLFDIHIEVVPERVISKSQTQMSKQSDFALERNSKNYRKV